MTKLMKNRRIQEKLASGVFAAMYRDMPWGQGLEPNTSITTKVAAIDHKRRRVLVHTGCKSDSPIPFQEFRENGEEKIPNVGDDITIMIKGMDANTGYVISSFREVKTKQRMEELKNILQKKTSIDVVVLYKIKPSNYNNSPMIHKSINYAVDLGCGIIGNLTGEHGDLQVGEKVTVDILKMEPKKFGIVVVRKATGDGSSSTESILQDHSNFREGEKHKIRINEIKIFGKDFGVIGEKIYGEKEKPSNNKYNDSFFLHSSQLFHQRRLRNLTEIEESFPIGKEVEIIASHRDPVRGNIVYSVRLLYNNFFEAFKNYLKTKEDNIVTGKIIEKRSDSFIVKVPFAYTSDNLQYFEGILYAEDLSWNYKESVTLQRTLQVGSEVTCKVMDFNNISSELEQGIGFIPLSMKHITKDPFQECLHMIKLGHIYPCQFVEAVEDRDGGFLVTLTAQNEEGETKTTSRDVIILVKHKEIGSSRVKVGTNSTAKVVNISQENRIIYASVRAAENENKEMSLQAYESNNKKEEATFGSIINKIKK